MNKFAPKSAFLKRRAVSLYRSGHSMEDVARMLQISSYSVWAWTKTKDKTSTIQSAISSAEKAAAARWSACELPTLAYVPQIQLTPKSKYTMRPA